MAGRRDHDRPAVVAWSLSLAAHLALSLAGASLLDGRESVEVRAPPRAPELIVEEIAIGLELPRASDGIARGAPTADLALPSEPQLGDERTPRPDSGHAGRGGEPEVSAAAVNLAPIDDEAHLSPALRSRLERAQEARRRRGQGRSSPEDDTVTERPMILTFFADGRGQRLEQRLAARSDPSGGASRGERVQSPAEPPRPRPDGDEWTARDWRPNARSRFGNAAPHMAGPGVLDRAGGTDSRSSAAVADGRPMALQGRDSTRASERGPEGDTVDAEQEVMAMYPSLLAASTAGGETGSGKGGQEGGGVSGAGGLQGAGSRAQAMGDGRGQGSGINPADARRRSYLRHMWQRVQASWSPSAFPKWAAMQGLAGTTIVSFVVGRDGSVSHVLTARSSGYPSFDAAMRAAVLRAAPFGAMPSELGPVLQHSHEFAVTNPAVR